MSTSTVTLVTHTRIVPNHNDEFMLKQQEINDVIATFPGYLDHSVIPPDPPVQPDWVIVQRFQTVDAAQTWLRSEQRHHLIDGLEPLIVGQDDIHLFTQDTEHSPSETVSAIISTRVKPGQEEAFRRWYQRISTAQTKFEGFQGYKLEPPIPGVQDDWVTILRFDSDAHLEAWLNSEQRRQILQEADTFSSDTRIRKARIGFESWLTFTGERQPGAPALWKVNMVVLLGLYPLVFLFSFFVQTPLLVQKGVPFWLALFIGNAVSTALLGWFLVPWLSRLLRWWLQPPDHAVSPASKRWISVAGTVLVLALYGLFLLVFSRFP